MKGSSKVVMGATLVMAVLLAIVLGLVLVLLAELYCSLLQRRRRQSVTATSTSDSIPTANPCSPQPSQTQLRSTPPPPRLASFYSQGVLCAPRSFLFPAVSSQEDRAEMKKQHSQLQPILEVQTPQSNNSPHRIGLLAASPPPPPSASPKPIQKGGGGGSSSCNDGVCGGGENFIYISNPIYDNEANRTDTPFETPDTSPSRLEMGSSSSGEDEVAQPSQSRPSSSSPPSTPPLTPMKKLPAEACSVSLRDARSLGTSGSDSNSINGLSSSSSGSPCTSPSW